jgi:hypothetical protein
MSIEISFDTINTEKDQNHLEGCYRIDNGEWKVFHFTHTSNGEWHVGDREIFDDAIFSSGIDGIEAIYPVGDNINNEVVINCLLGVTGESDWSVVVGPDSLTLK